MRINKTEPLNKNYGKLTICKRHKQQPPQLSVITNLKTKSLCISDFTDVGVVYKNKRLW